MRFALAAMGTRFELVLGPAEPPSARGAAEAALEEIEQCGRRLSRFAPDSLLAHLARIPAGTPVPLDADTFALFADARRVYDASDGAFDPTGPARCVGAVVLDPAGQTVTLTRGGIPLDFGGIAKGHALDLAARVLREAGVRSAFLHGGTSSAVAIGTGASAAPWRVALRGGRSDVIGLSDAALSVSAAWRGNPHPTVDPRTGRRVPAPRRAAVIGPSARLADAWSTAALVLGRRPPGLGDAWECLVRGGGRSSGNATPRAAAPRAAAV